MGNLTKKQVSLIIDGRVADYSELIWVYIPSTFEQPVVMYKSIIRQEQTKHYLGHDIKKTLKAGMHKYEGGI